MKPTLQVFFCTLGTEEVGLPSSPSLSARVNLLAEYRKQKSKLAIQQEKEFSFYLVSSHDRSSLLDS
ncbi:hypothetical protein RRG08_064654 [Elysia crispata]|uniref:Uncharacterized protein n=1 Tax=Elysia crispata TaxID=231223 RepID=A0AAE1BAQ6_9GAST|nr:hypothetical protein RRG08_064654 [Elysia crispata]